MILEYLQNRPWAIRPSKLEEIEAFLIARVNGEDIFPSMEAGKSGGKAEKTYAVTSDGYAEIPVWGTIEKRMNLMSDFSGGTSTEILKRDIGAALNDKKVKGIILNIDSPGGAVDGTKELSDFLFSVRGRKPIVAYVDGMMASAAYWIGSAADLIVAGDTSVVGSIGVALTHYDFSARDEARGVKRTPITAGKYKRIASDEKPLSPEAQEYLQDLVDTYYSMFVESVARNRGVTVEKALNMADGKEFIGKKAQIAGLVDFIGTRDFALSKLRERSFNSMDVKTLKEQHPETFDQIFKSGQAQGEGDLTLKVETAKTEAVNKERSRVKEILEAKADPEVTMKAIVDGTPSADAYRAFYQAEKNKREAGLNSMRSSAPKSVGAEQPQNPTNQAEADGFLAKVAELEASGKTKAEAVRETVAKHPNLHQAYLAGLNK
jgi:capsid assembly protease